ncbi:MAG: hypothetical protein P8L31_07820 [Pseudomonadales bacterium]|nr:hypothetical protein [Pseudomonadales bacterium]
MDEIVSLSRLNENFQAECTPGYYNNDGQPNPKSVQNGAYGKGSNPHFKQIKTWREADNLPGLEVT